MSENKCCGSCKHFKDEDAEGFGFCIADKYVHHITGGGLCVVHQFKDNGWTEITPDNVDEVDCIPRDKVIVGWICNEEFRSCSLSTFWFTLKSIAEQGGFYYFVLPELSISDE